jgi:hypothetical protein
MQTFEAKVRLKHSDALLDLNAHRHVQGEETALVILVNQRTDSTRKIPCSNRCVSRLLSVQTMI